MDLLLSVVIIHLSNIIFNLGVGEIFDRVVVEIIQKMKDMKMVSMTSIQHFLKYFDLIKIIKQNPFDLINRVIYMFIKGPC